MIHKGSESRKIKGSIVICKSNGSDGHNFHMTVEDQLSGHTVLDVYMTPEEFAMAVSGTMSKCKGTVYMSDTVGKKMNVKTLNIRTSGFDLYKEWETFCEYAEQYVNDNFPGWVMDKLDKHNHYKDKNIVDGQGKVLGRAYEVIIRSWAEIIELGKEDSESFIAEMNSPTPPNEALKKAFKTHSKGKT